MHEKNMTNGLNCDKHIHIKFGKNISNIFLLINNTNLCYFNIFSVLNPNLKKCWVCKV